MPTVPVVSGRQVQSDIAVGTPGAMVDTPQFATPDARLRRPAALEQQKRGFVKKDAFEAAYNPYERYKPEPSRYANTGAQTLTNLGGALAGAADTALDIATRVQMQASAMLVDNAVSQTKMLRIRLSDGDGKEGNPLGFRNVLGGNALNRESGKPLSDEYAERFDEGVKEIAKGLKTPAQQKAFGQQALAERQALYGQAVAHQSVALRDYNMDTQKAVIAVESENIALNFDNPIEVQRSVDRLKGAVGESALAMGKAPGMIDVLQKDAVSKAHSMALKTAMSKGRTVYADAYLERYKDDMTANDVLEVRGAITKDMDDRYSVAAADDAVATHAAKFNPTHLDNLTGVIMGQESGGRETDPKTGKRMTSSAGALGIMQVMPETLKKPGFGIKPSNGTPEDDARVGREYIPAMVKRYSGDVALTLAAYNAGPGRVDDAIAEAKKPENAGKSWLNFVPPETQKYVRSGLAKVQAGDGKPAEPTLEEALATVRSDPRVANSPDRLTKAEARVKSRFAEIKYAKTEREEAGTATALKWLDENNGDYDRMPLAIKQGAPADKLPSLRSFGDQVKSATIGGAGTVTNLAVYQKLSDTAYLKSLSEDQFYAMRTQLDVDDFKKFSGLREKAPTDQTPGNLAAGFDDALKSNLVGYQLDPKKDAVQLGTITKFVREKVFAAQATQGKKFTDAETEAFVNGLFVKETTLRGAWGGSNPTPILTMKYSQLSADDKNGIKAAFKARGVQNPSEEDILAAFWRMQTKGQ